MDGMRIDRRLTLLGVMLVVLSTVMATQYATTKVGYSYSLVHPSNADIRFVGSDNCSDDGLRVLRVEGTNTTVTALITVKLGEWAPGMNKTYTAAFAIVNEEPFSVNITHVTVTNATTGATSVGNYLQIWLHSNGSKQATDETYKTFVYNNGTALKTASDTSWRLARGDQSAATMRANLSNISTDISTPWDQTSDVRYTLNLTQGKDNALGVGNKGRTYANASDFVWVQISVNIPRNCVAGETTGVIEFHFKATTHNGED